MDRLNKDNPVTASCGCVNRIGGEIDFCKIHKDAPAVFERMKKYEKVVNAAQQYIDKQNETYFYLLKESLIAAKKES